MRPFFPSSRMIPFGIFFLFLSAAGPSFGRENNSGFFPKRSSQYVSFENAACIEFDGLRIHGLTVVYWKLGGTETPVRRDRVGEIFFYVDFSSLNVTTEDDIKKLEERKNFCREYVKKYPTSSKVVAEEVARIDEVIRRFTEGYRLLNGKWLSGAEFEKVSKMKGWTGIPEMRVGNRNFLNVLAVRQNGLWVSLKHKNGVEEIIVDRLTDLQISDLNRVSDVRVERVTIAGLEKAALEKVAEKRERIDELQELIAAERSRIQKESGKKCAEIENLAREAFAAAEKSVKDRIDEAEKRKAHALDSLEKLNSTPPIELENLSELIYQSGEKIRFNVELRLNKAEFKKARFLKGDSIFLISLSGGAIGLLCGDSTLFGEGGVQEGFIHQVSVDHYTTKTGFVRMVPIFAFSDPMQVLQLDGAQKNIRSAGDKIEESYQRVEAEKTLIEQLELAIERPEKSNGFGEYLDLIVQLEELRAEAAADQEKVTDPKYSPRYAEILRLEKETEEVMDEFQETKKRLLSYGKDR